MPWRGEVEDGTGWDGLVPTKAERDAEKAERAMRDREYRRGRSDEREQWVPLENLLRAAFHGKQDEGSVTLSLAEVLSISVALERAERG